MIDLKNIHSLSNFQRNSKNFIRRLKKSGRPEILTVNGEAQLVVLSADAYQKILDELDLAQIQNAASGGALEAFRSGKITAEELLGSLQPQPRFAGVPAQQAFAALEKKLDGHRKKKAS